jgi:AmmeMemoRadiSam system protein A
MSPQEVARIAVETFVREQRLFDPAPSLEGILADRAGVFVTLRTAGGLLRGCVGTIVPVHLTVAGEIVQNAIKAAVDDPRFAPVALDELPDLRYGVDVLSAPETISGVADLDPDQYGIIIETLDGHRRAVLLPRIDGIQTAEEQWFAVHMKAGIQPGSEVAAKRFTVRRFGKD